MMSFPTLRMAVQWKDQVFDNGHDCLQGADVIIAPMRTFPGTITHVILHLYFVSDIAVFVLKRDIKLQLTTSSVFYKLTHKSPSSWPLAAKNCQVQWLNSGGTGRNGVPPPLFSVPPPKIAVPLPKVVVLPPGDAVPSP